MSNFNFLPAQYNKAKEDFVKAEKMIDQQKDAYLFLRRAVEIYFSKLRQSDTQLNIKLKTKSKATLGSYLNYYFELHNVEKNLLKNITEFKNRANEAVHPTHKKVNNLTEELLIKDFNSIINFIGKTAKIKSFPTKFSKNKIPKGKKPDSSEINEIRNDLAKKDDEIARLEVENEQVKNENKILELKLQSILEEEISSHKIKSTQESLNTLAQHNVIIDNSSATDSFASIKPSYFVNFTADNKKYYCVKHGDSIQIPHILVGNFENDKYYKNHPKLIKNLDNEYTSSKINELENYILKRVNIKYSYFGSYYSNSEIGSYSLYRNLLEIRSSNSNENSNYDALVVMMNPGGSYPLNKKYPSFKFEDKIKIQLVPCKPDDTQYQIESLMAHKGWEKVAIINLLDICNTSSSNAILRIFNENKSDIKPSILTESRRGELNIILGKLNETSPIIMGWGVDKNIKYADESEINAFNKYNQFRRKIFNDFITQQPNPIVGLLKENTNHDYYHPWPRGDRFEDTRTNWPSIINQQLNELVQEQKS